MSKVQNFMERCLNGTALPDEIDEYVDKWHSDEDGSGLPLHAYLGMDTHEYALWMRDPSAIYSILGAHRNHRSVDEYIEDYYSMPLAARAKSPADAERLTDWLGKLGKLK